MLVHQSLDYFVVVVICGCTDNGSVRHWVLCVFFRKYMCGVDVLDKGCGGIFNVLSTSSLMSFTFTWCMCLRWYCCWCVWLVLWVAGGFLCRVLCISVLSLSRLCMISLGLVFFGFGTKDSPLLRTSISAVVSILLLRLTIVSVVLGC